MQASPRAAVVARLSLADPQREWMGVGVCCGEPAYSSIDMQEQPQERRGGMGAQQDPGVLLCKCNPLQQSHVAKAMMLRHCTSAHD